MSAITIRKAVLSDANNIAEAEKSYIDCPWTEEQIREEIGNAQSLFFVAEANGRFVGYISGTVASDECELANIAVVEEYRRQGAAKKLFEALIGGVRGMGASSMFLLVRDDNAIAISLYKKIGFTVVGGRTRYYKGKDALIMRLNL